MTTGDDPLDRECVALVRHLVGEPPSDHVRAAYREAHARLGGRLAPVDREQPLLDLARRGPFSAALVDCYTRLFRPTGAFRRKIALLLAILETAPESAGRFLLTERVSTAGIVVRLVPRGLGFALRLALALAVVGPLDLAGSRATRRTGRSPDRRGAAKAGEEAPWSA